MTVVPLPPRPARTAAASPAISIRELAARTGTTLRALRHYEDIGLLTAGRRPSGARCYDSEQRRRAALIARLRRLGMPTPDIDAALTAVSGDQIVTRFLSSEIAAAEARLRDLRAAIDELEAGGLEGLGSGTSPASVATVDRSARLRHAR
ncbi:MerR family transcriptional regulator [Brevundimonas sp.]|uniref:MerR family transcriptional regulator n=1 Tax=Brevundimonas sp. TaxID=1871086 RepID=UPI0025C4BEC8|nr:MerR family transcriptional regulator [Brevundimonas sp.]